MPRPVAIVPAVLLLAAFLPWPAASLAAIDDPLLAPLGRAIAADPAGAPALGEALAVRLGAAPTSLEGALLAGWDLGRGTPLLSAPTFAGPLAVEIALAHEEAGTPLAPADRLRLAQDAATLDPRVERALATLVAAMRVAEQERGAPFASLSPEEIAFLALRADAGRPVDPPATHAQLLGEGAPTDLLAARDALAGIDVDGIARGHVRLARAVDDAVALLSIPRGATPGSLFEADTPYGRIVVQGTGSDVVAAGDEAFVRIDLGGDDTYLNGAGSSKADVLNLTLLTPPPSPTDPAFVVWAQTTERLVHASHNASIVLDVAGNDRYLASAPGAQGYGGWGGFGALVDLGGDDAYAGDRFVQGAGQVAGAGFLVDAAGVDTYLADRQAQAFGQDAGGGFLLDGLGADTYDAQVMAQGSGYSANLVGMLVDGEGDDLYRCHGVIDSSDSILPVNAPRPGTICHAAGFGGTGVQVDLAGNDLYTTVSSFQAMTLIGSGILVDAAGDDQYVAGEWSNGMAVLGASALVDLSGADTYESVQTTPAPWADVYIGSNGEAYLGTAVLADGGGNDRYRSVATKGLFLEQYACGQGCSYSGGTALLLDAGGDDEYTTEVGHGGAFIGIAALVDAGGADRYTLTLGSTRGQGYAEATPVILVVLPNGPADCYYGVIADAGGADAYSNPLTDFGARGDEQYWGQGDFGRGMDGQGGIAGYLTSPEFSADVDHIVGERACETTSPIVLGLLCQIGGPCVGPL